ncbi:MAG: hypothetical protein HY077_17360 [Elusimicrobia bacterium]|nr:hypothetical protein [Elusimicrobiota bacterium]
MDQAARPGHERLMTAMLLGIVVLASLNLKVRLSTFTPRYDPEDETGYFRTESAYQYRYARMVADGLPLPELDRDAQYPEGVRPTRELTPLMEYATGWAYRLAKAVGGAGDLRWFVILWVAASSSLTIPAFYLLALRLCRFRPLALAACAAYGLSWAAQSNLVASYVFESFAQPLMFGSLACLCAALDEPPRRRAWACGGGVLMAAALSSWHLARFYWATVILVLAWLAWRRRGEGEALRASLAWMAAPLLLAGLSVPCLRESAFVFSPGMILTYGLLAWLWFPRKRVEAAVLTAAALALAAWWSRDAAAYAHVYSYLAAKLRFGLVRPADPALLSNEARSIWNGPADSPSPGFLVFSLLPLGLLAAPRLLAAARKEKSPESLSGSLVDGLLLLYAAGAVVALRLMPLFVFLLCLAALRLPEKNARRLGLTLFVVLLAALEGFKTFAPASRLNPFIRVAAALPDDDRHPATTFSHELAVIRWLKAKASAKPVLADISFSANFLVYAGVPVLVHPKFEAPGIRAKVAEYLKALFSDEESFYAFCRKYGADYFVLSAYDLLDETPDGPRYTSGSMRLTPKTAAVLLHFKPESLRHFRLAYQNEDFRIYEVGPRPETKPAGKGSPIYDLSQYAPATSPDGALRLDIQGVLARLKESRQKLFVARVLLQGRMPEAALEYYEGALKAWPDENARAEYERLRRSLESRR